MVERRVFHPAVRQFCCSAEARGDRPRHFFLCSNDVASFTVLPSPSTEIVGGVNHVDSTRKAADQIETDSRRRGRASAPRVRFRQHTDFDPFLLLDDFRNDVPEDYLAGFPWHPHRGIETITYVLAGTVEHGDSMGNHGAIAAGDVQWMTAGSGIIHQEMPKGDPAGRMHGFQLVGESSGVAQDDRAALSGSEVAGDS